MDWDSVAVMQQGMPSYPSLTSMSANNLVQDKLREIEELVTNCRDQAAISAGISYGAIAKNSNVKTATPGGGAKSFAQITEMIEALVTYMHLPATIDAHSKRAYADANALPATIFRMAFAIIDASLDYACAFCQQATLLLTSYYEGRQKHLKGITRYADNRPNQLSAEETVQALREIRASHNMIAAECVKSGYERAIAAQKVQQGASGSKSGPSANLMQEILQSQKSCWSALETIGKQVPKGPGVKPEPHPDGARGAFQHNTNRAQETAAEKEKSAASKHLVILKALPSDPAMRKQAISRGLCQFYWQPEGEQCRRDPCRFAHMTQAETKEAGIDDAEIRAAFARR